MITFDKIVNKLGKMKGCVVNILDIGNIIDPDYYKSNTKYKSIVYKTVYRLKSNEIIIPLRNGIYYIPDDPFIKQVDIINNNYWKIAHKIIMNETNGNYLIAGNKSLELHLKDNGIHNNLIVYTKDIQKKVTVGSNLFISFKILSLGKKLSNTSEFSFLKSNTLKLLIDGINFNVANEELALLDSLLVSNNKSGIDDYLIDKFLKKYSKFLSREKLGNLVKFRYISSVNRLRIIAKKNSYEGLYSDCLDIIKKEGANCFLTL